MTSTGHVIAVDAGTPPTGYHQFHRDLSINFQCNRWLQFIGAEAFDEIAAVARASDSYPQWITGYLQLAESARGEGRTFAAAYYDRAAEFFMAPDDPHRAPARTRFVEGLRATYDVTPDQVPYQGSALPAYDLCPGGEPASTFVLFGGFDSYIEELLPALLPLVEAGHRVIAFDGPGQGGALDQFGLAMTPHWEEPVTAVLDHYNLDDVTAVGASLGGGLVIRAAAFEPRIRRVVAWGVLEDFLKVLTGQIHPAAPPAVKLLLALRARPIINAVARAAAASKPVSAWGLQHGMHVTGTSSPYEFLNAARSFTTRDISDRVTADVLLLAGADDHLIPLSQLPRQAANLTNARSVSTRVFTAAEQASNHCQVGNVGLALRTILAWQQTLSPPLRPGRAFGSSSRST